MPPLLLRDAQPALAVTVLDGLGLEESVPVEAMLGDTVLEVMPVAAPLDAVPLGATELGDAMFEAMPVAATPDVVPLGATELADTTFEDMPVAAMLDGVPPEATELANMLLVIGTDWLLVLACAGPLIDAKSTLLFPVCAGMREDLR